MAQAFKGFDIDVFPGDAALRDAAAQGFSWVAAYLPAPSHHDAGWPAYATLKASGLNIVPVWVGAQIIGPGSHAVGDSQGASEGYTCVAELRARGYPGGTGVVFDTENGAPVPALQLAHLTAWRDAVNAGGYRAMVYGSYENFGALAAAFGTSNVWEFEILNGLPGAFSGVAIQYEQEVQLALAGKSYSVDRSVSTVPDPAYPGGVSVIDQGDQPSMIQIPGTPAAPVTAPTPVIPAPTPTAKAVQAAPPIAAALTAAATAAIGAVHITSGYRVDLSGLVNAAAPFLVIGVVLPLVVWLVGRGLQQFHINAQSAAAQFVIAAVENGVRAEAAQALTYIDGHAVVAVHDQMAANVLTYVNTAVPAKLAASGITSDQLANLVSNRLAQIAPPPPGATP